LTDKEGEGEKEKNGTKKINDDNDSFSTAKGHFPSPSSSSRKDFQYVVLTIGVHTKIYSAAKIIHKHDIGEISFFPSLVSQTKRNCNAMQIMVVDSLYASREACSTVAGYGAKPYFLPRSNCTLRSYGVKAYSTMLHELMDDT
jgi:hypothetical protein